MAWDTEGTRTKLLDAGTAEFARHGLAGGRIDRIAEAAGVNKERIYQYFGNKRGLFDSVLARRLVQAADAVPFDGDTPEEIARYAGDMFDFHADDPTLARLLTWEGLELAEPVDLARRHDHMVAKTDHLARALPQASRQELGELLLTIVTLACSWPVLHVAATIDPQPNPRSGRRAAIEETIRHQAQALAARLRHRPHP